MGSLIEKLSLWWAHSSPSEVVWLCIGLTGQMMFSMRWLLQWWASERVRSTVVPANFWYYSLLGGIMVLSYGVYKLDEETGHDGFGGEIVRVGGGACGNGGRLRIAAE